MKIQLFVATILLAVFSTSKAFADVVIRAEIDKTSLTTDENLTYKLTITSTEQNTPSPQIPKFEGFTVLSQTQSSSFSFTKGNLKTGLEFSFILAPEKEGKFKIAPATIKIKDKTYSTEAFEIEVKQGQAQPQPPRQQPPSGLPEEPEETKLPQITL